MASIGVFFALDNDQNTKVLAAAERDDDSIYDILDEVEENEDEENMIEIDKSWDAMHRCLTDGELAFDNGGHPLSHCVLGGTPLCGDGETFVVHKSHDDVVAISSALQTITKDWMDSRYKAYKHRITDWSSEDFEYTWDYFIRVRDFYTRVVDTDRPVIFTVQ